MTLVDPTIMLSMEHPAPVYKPTSNGHVFENIVTQQPAIVRRHLVSKSDKYINKAPLGKQLVQNDSGKMRVKFKMLFGPGLLREGKRSKAIDEHQNWKPGEGRNINAFFFPHSFFGAYFGVHLTHRMRVTVYHDLLVGQSRGEGVQDGGISSEAVSKASRHISELCKTLKRMRAIAWAAMRRQADFSHREIIMG